MYRIAAVGDSTFGEWVEIGARDHFGRGRVTVDVLAAFGARIADAHLQLARVHPQTDMLLVAVGPNDAGFQELVGRAALSPGRGPVRDWVTDQLGRVFLRHGREVTDDWVRERIDAQRGPLRGIYEAAAAMVKTTVVIPPPDPFDDRRDSARWLFGVSPSTLPVLHRATEYWRRTTLEASKGVTDVFDAHKAWRLDTGGRVAHLTAGWKSIRKVTRWDKVPSYHLNNDSGQQEMALLWKRWLDERRPGATRPW
jgi:hypothetical protein